MADQDPIPSRLPTPSRLPRPSRLQRVAGAAIARLMRTVKATSKVNADPPDAAELLVRYSPAIVGYWHGQFMMLPAYRVPDLPIDIILARHSDAEPLSHAIRSFGLGLIRGAGAGDRKKDRGGAKALRAALNALAAGRSVGCSLDAPPGPARIAGLGIVTIARLSGRPIVPVAIASSRMQVLPTWSKFTINLPFSTIGFALGEPIHVPRELADDGLESYRKKVEDAMNEATVRAYRLAGADINKTLPAHAANGPLPPGLTLNAYRGLTTALKPAMPALLKYRTRRGKEDASRRPERLGIASKIRPEGRLIWFHAASVGETNAALPIIDRFATEHPDATILLTTGTVTSAGVARERLPASAIHQYLPLDVTAHVRTFLDHWRPDLAVFVESEIWPNLVMETASRHIPLLLVNGRMSGRSFRNWSRRQTSAAALFTRLDRVLAQNPTFAKRFTKLGSRSVEAVGNLKVDAPPPPVDTAELARLQTAFAGRPVWLAASTHKGEEVLIADAYRGVLREHPDVQLIIAPRHPGRGAEVAETLAGIGISAARRSLGEMPTPDRPIYIADTIGELGTFFAVAKVAFIGGSLIPHGGQNPLEPIKLGCSVITGPNWQNFEDFYSELLREKACREISDSASLAAAVNELLSDPEALSGMVARARAALVSLGGALDRTLSAIDELWARTGPAGG